MGGGTKVLHIYAEALTKRGHDVLVASIPASKYSIFYQIKYFVKHLKLPIATNTKITFFDCATAKHKVLESHRPIKDTDLPDADVVIATWWETAEWAFALSPSKGKKVYFVQGHEVFDYLPVERAKKTYHYPMQKIAVSNWLAGIMKNEYGDENCIVVPNSIDHNQFYAHNRHKNQIPTVGFLYSSTYIKGVDTTLNAIKMLKQIVPNLRVISFGTHRPEKNPDVDIKIEFFENPDQNDIRGIYSLCDVWLSASLTEGFNLTVMEAMACGTPVIATKTGWPFDAIENYKNGVLVDFNRPLDMCDAANKILAMSNLEWKQLSDSSLKTVLSSNWQDSITAFENALYAIRDEF